MSAYVVDPKVINLIVSAPQCAIRQEGKYPSKYPDLRYLNAKNLREMAEEPAELGRAMYSMNVNAVEQRYPDSELPGTYTDGQHLDAYKYQFVLDTNRMQVYKYLQSYLYQCTEGDVGELPLYKALVEFRAQLAQHMIEHSDEYEKAAW